MRRLPYFVQLLLAPLICLALAIGPAAAFSSPKAAHSNSQLMTDAGDACHTPCDDCAGSKQGTTCAAICAGMISLFQPHEQAGPGSDIAQFVAPSLRLFFTGREDEPDKPPPRTFLA